MELSEYCKDLVRKTEHRFPDKIKPIYLQARKFLDQYIRVEQSSDKKIADIVLEIILPSIAIYHAVIKYTGDADRAYDIVSRCFEDYFEEKAESFREACRKALFSNMVPTIAADFIKKNYSEKDGFQLVNRSKGMKLCHFDVVECPYFHYCRKYRCEELTTAFCDVADIAFDHLHRGISWDRTETLGRGDGKCNFIVSVDD